MPFLHHSNKDQSHQQSKNLKVKQSHQDHLDQIIESSKCSLWKKRSKRQEIA